MIRWMCGISNPCLSWGRQQELDSYHDAWREWVDDMKRDMVRECEKRHGRTRDRQRSHPYQAEMETECYIGALLLSQYDTNKMISII